MSSETDIPTTSSSAKPNISDSENVPKLATQHLLAIKKAQVDAGLEQYHDSERRLAKATREAPEFHRPLTERESDDSTQLWQIYNIVQKIDNVQQDISANYPRAFGENLAALNVLLLNFLGLLSTLNDDREDEGQASGNAGGDEYGECVSQSGCVFAASASHVAQIDVYCGELRQILFVTVESLFKAGNRDEEGDWKKVPAGKLEEIRKSFKMLQAPRRTLKSHRSLEWVGQYITAAVEAGGEEWRTITGDSVVLWRV